MLEEANSTERHTCGAKTRPGAPCKNAPVTGKSVAACTVVLRVQVRRWETRTRSSMACVRGNGVKGGR
jgi:hypothetical protein